MVSHLSDMVSHMKTTLTIPDPVMDRLRAEARRRGVPMSSLVEAVLRRLLDDTQPPAETVPELPRWNSGGLLVDVADHEALHTAMDGT